MNQATEKPKDKERLDKIFERAWPDFESDMSAALAKVPSPKPERKLQDMMAEVVETVRHMDRRLDEDLTRAYERALRLDEFSASLGAEQMGRPFVATSGQPISPKYQRILGFQRSRIASPPWDRPESEDVANRESPASSE